MSFQPVLELLVNVQADVRRRQLQTMLDREQRWGTGVEIRE